MSLLIVEQNVHAVLATWLGAPTSSKVEKLSAKAKASRLLQDDHVRAAYLGPLARGTSA